jgi:hypothetical protein
VQIIPQRDESIEHAVYTQSDWLPRFFGNMTDDIDNKLEILRQSREKLKKLLSETAEKLAQIDDTISSWTERQESRIDERIDNKLVDKFAQENSKVDSSREQASRDKTTGQHSSNDAKRGRAT